MAGLPDICTFWHGTLGPLEQICLTSFVERGHRVRLFAYDRPAGLPTSVDWVDAETIMPREKMFFYKGSRTPAVFADLFRLALMDKSEGIWADCDVFCLRPFAGLPDYVFGYENEPSWRNGGAAQVNQAVFACPSGSPLLEALQAVFTSDDIPPGLPFWRHWEIATRRALGQKVPVHYMQFGATGPAPLNHYVKALGLTHFVQPRDVFYPVSYGQTQLLLQAGVDIGQFVTARTLGIHLWNSALTGRNGGQVVAQEGSFIAREMARLGQHGIDRV